VSSTTLRSLLEAALARTGGPGLAEAPAVAPVRRGFAYVCQCCDVYGYLGPDDPQVCWSCDSAEALDRR
jgi:hypothetical protein